MTNISFALNENNDMYLGPDGNLVMVTGVDAVQQDCECAMRAQYGEMIFQPLDGLPNLTDVWIARNFAKWEAAARRALMRVPGVTQVVSLIYDIVPDGEGGYSFSYAAQIQTIYSNALTINESIRGLPQA
jgi:hypothetical protein